MEFANLVLIFLAGWLVLRKPEKERLAFGLLVVSVLVMVALFSLATRTSLLPGVTTLKGCGLHAYRARATRP